MQIVTVKRSDNVRIHPHYGRISARLQFIEDDCLERDDRASGLMIFGHWYELPDNPRGTYLLTEWTPRNIFGYYEGRPAQRELVLESEASEDAVPLVRIDIDGAVVTPTYL